MAKIFDEDGKILDGVDSATRKIVGATIGFVASEIKRRLNPKDPDVKTILGWIEQTEAEVMSGDTTPRAPSTSISSH